MKKLIKGSINPSGVLDMDRLLEAILLFRNTPLHDGRMPSVMVYGHPVKDALPAHRRYFERNWVDEIEKMEKNSVREQEKIEKRYNQHARDLPELRRGAPVAVRDEFRRWTRAGTIVEVMKNRDYLVKLNSGRVIRRNRRLIRRRYPTVSPAAPAPHSPGPA